MMIDYLIVFVAFLFFGWIIDTTYRSIVEKRYAPGTLLHYVSPIYGFGATALLLLYNLKLPVFSYVFIGGIMLTVIEYVGGVFCKVVLKRRLWDYSATKWNLHGHINVLHTFYWFLLTGISHVIFARIL